MAESNSQVRSNRVFLTVLGIISLLALAYAIMRVDILRARIAELEVSRDQQKATNDTLLARNAELSAANVATQEQLKRLSSMEVELTNLSATMGELRGRTEQSQRNWTRVEALYLLRLAEDQLHLTQDVPTALVALQAAELRLNGIRETALDGVRLQLAADIDALRNVPQIDRAALYTQLENAATMAANLKVFGTVVNAKDDNRAVDGKKSGIERAWLLIKQALTKLFVVRKASTNAEGLLSIDEQSLRRHHLQSLLLSARQSAQLRDAKSYRDTLQQAQRWLNTAFDTNNKDVMSLNQQLTALSKLEVAPTLPDISGSRKLLERYVPGIANP